jgi:hypothetical protein
MTQVQVERDGSHMTRTVQLVRLAAAVAVGLAACTFVIIYNNVSDTRFTFDHPDATAGRTPFINFVTTSGIFVYAVPLAWLLAGIVIIWRWPKSHAMIELLVSTLWIMACIWVGLILIAWQGQNIPVFSGMRAHY